MSVCVHIAPAETGAEGRNLKATGEHWWLGTGSGAFRVTGRTHRAVDTRLAQAHTYFRTAFDSSAGGLYVTAPSTIPTSNTTRTYSVTKHDRIRMERIAASAYDDNHHTATKNGRSGGLACKHSTDSAYSAVTIS